MCCGREIEECCFQDPLRVDDCLEKSLGFLLSLMPLNTAFPGYFWGKYRARNPILRSFLLLRAKITEKHAKFRHNFMVERRFNRCNLSPTSTKYQ